MSLQSLVTSLQPMEGTRRAGSWEYTKPLGREGRAWGPPLQRQGRTAGEQCVLPVLRGSGPTNRTGSSDPNGVGVRRRQTRPGRPESNTFKARCPASGFYDEFCLFLNGLIDIHRFLFSSFIFHQHQVPCPFFLLIRQNRGNK